MYVELIWVQMDHRTAARSKAILADNLIRLSTHHTIPHGSLDGHRLATCYTALQTE